MGLLTDTPDWRTATTLGAGWLDTGSTQTIAPGGTATWGGYPAGIGGSLVVKVTCPSTSVLNVLVGSWLTPDVTAAPLVSKVVSSSDQTTVWVISQVAGPYTGVQITSASAGDVAVTVAVLYLPTGVDPTTVLFPVPQVLTEQATLDAGSTWTGAPLTSWPGTHRLSVQLDGPYIAHVDVSGAVVTSMVWSTQAYGGGLTLGAFDPGGLPWLVSVQSRSSANLELTVQVDALGP